MCLSEDMMRDRKIPNSFLYNALYIFSLAVYQCPALMKVKEMSRNDMRK